MRRFFFPYLPPHLQSKFGLAKFGLERADHPLGKLCPFAVQTAVFDAHLFVPLPVRQGVSDEP